MVFVSRESYQGRIDSSDVAFRTDGGRACSTRFKFIVWNVVADTRFMGLVNSLNKDFDTGRERLNVLRERLTREWL
jgi:hypothetical protein